MTVRKPLILQDNSGKFSQLPSNSVVDGIWVYSTKTHLNDDDTLLNRNSVILDSSTSSFTLNLPSNPSQTDIIQFIDKGGSCSTNPITIGRNSELIRGIADDLLISVDYLSFELIFVGGSLGWNLININ